MSSEELPIFPLSSVVLFPGIRCPLHIFEPRYRQMTAHALRSERRIGMVTVRPEHVGQMSGDPPVFAVGCAGIITENQELPDGRYNILLSGTQRFRILREPARPSGQLFRSAEILPLDDAHPSGDAERVTALRERCLELAAGLMAHLAPGRPAPFSDANVAGLEDAVLVNALCSAFPFPPVEKQGLLEADSVAERFGRLESLLSIHLAGALGVPPDPGRLH